MPLFVTWNAVIEIGELRNFVGSGTIQEWLALSRSCREQAAAF